MVSLYLAYTLSTAELASVLIGHDRVRIIFCPRNPDGGDLWERPGVRRLRRHPQPLQLQLGRGLREESLRRHAHLLPRLSLPVRPLPRGRGLSDHVLQGELTQCWSLTPVTSTSAPTVLPTRPPATRVWPTLPRNTCATTPTTWPTVTPRLRAWWGSSARLPTSSRLTLWPGGSFHTPGQIRDNDPLARFHSDVSL